MGAERALEEEYYIAAPINEQPALALKKDCVLLSESAPRYFEVEYYVIWDPASGYGTLGRDYSDDIVAFIPQKGETLTIAGVYESIGF